MAQASIRIEDDSQNKQESGSGADFLAVMLRRKWVVFLVAAMGVGLGYLSYTKTTKLYEATARIVIRQTSPMYSTGGDLRMSGEMQYVGDKILSTESVVINSPKNIRKAVEQYNLDKLVSFQGADTDGIVGAIIGGLSITKGGDSLSTEDANVLKVSYRGTSAEDCVAVVSNVLKAYEDSLKGNSQEVADETLRLITDARDGMQQDITKKQTKYNEWRKNSNLLFIDKSEGGNIHAVRLGSIERKRLDVQMKLLEVRSHIQSLEEALKGGVVKDALLLLVERTRGGTRAAEAQKQGSAVEGQLFQLLVDEQMLMQAFGIDHPRVKAVRKQIELVQDMLGLSRTTTQPKTPTELLADHIESQKQEVRDLELQEKVLTSEWDREREAARQDLDAQILDETQREDIERSKRLFDQVVVQLQQLQSMKDPGGFKTETIAVTGSKNPVQPVLIRSLSIGGVLGLVLGVALAYVIDLADKSFRTPDEIRGQLKLPVIGHIPIIETHSRRRKNQDSASKIDQSVACHHRPRSTVAEAYRSVRTALYFGTRGEEHKVIQVTSADAGDGKTTLTCNLAVSIAQSGKRVCLIDCDFRRSRIHEVFGVDASSGISNVIAGRGDLNEAIQTTEIENLFVLPAGPKPPNPSELLTSHRFKEVLDALRAKFDTIIIDTPPLLAVTDPSAVAPRVDSVLLVMRITKNVRPNAQRAKEVLDGLGANVVGVVVNGVEMRQGYGHDSGYRRYATGYGYRDINYGDYYEDEADEKAANEPVATPPVKPAASA